VAGVVTSASQPIPGGANCVPRVPQPPTFTTTACGTILEALKYEKRIELAFLPLGAWFFRRPWVGRSRGGHARCSIQCPYSSWTRGSCLTTTWVVVAYPAPRAERTGSLSLHFSPDT
jgi:hypothetical protein